MSAINYTRVNFKDYPDTTTPITAQNLNKLDKGVYDLDVALAATNELLGTASQASGVSGATAFAKIGQLNSDLAVQTKSFTVSSIVGTNEFSIKQIGSVLYLQGYCGISGGIPSQLNTILTINNYDGIKRQGTVILGSEKGISKDPARICIIDTNGQLQLDVEATDNSDFYFFNVEY